MTHQTISPIESPHKACRTDLEKWREAGAALSRANPAATPGWPPARLTCVSRRQLRDLFARAASDPDKASAAWVLENIRLILGAQKTVRRLVAELPKLPAVLDSSGGVAPRITELARAFLQVDGNRFGESEFLAFVQGYQEHSTLEIDEIRWLQAALQLELTVVLASAAPVQWPVLVESLRTVADPAWRDIFETVSYSHRLLARDPAGAYSRMDSESQDRYLKTIVKLAKHSAQTEAQIAQAVIDLCRQALAGSDGSRAAARRAHVGFYLVDQGRAQLEARIGYHAPVLARIPGLILRHPASFYLVGIELLTLLIVFVVLYRLDSRIPAFAGLALLVLPATQAAIDFVNNLTAFLVPPRTLPKLDFSDGIPDECTTMVAVPTLLLNEARVHDLVLDLEIRFLANRDPNLYFALLTDCPDSDRSEDQHDVLVGLCRRLIEGLNLRYGRGGRSPFFLFHRNRSYNRAEGCWMGWERKRGKLIDLNRLLRGDDAAFPVKAGDLSVLPSVRYVITLDSDTQLPRDSAARLIGAIAHPLNQAVVDPVRRTVVEGYGILQPRIGISIQSAARSRLAALYSGQTGFDIYTRAISDVYQDLFGEGIFTGKGIYEVDTMREALENRFPENALLSHDLIEGAYARAALASDIELIDDYPSHFSAYSRRKHRWVRGDWQIMRWIRARVPDFEGRMIANPIALISQWKIVDNLRRSLLEPGLVLLLLSGWLWLPGRAEYWTAATLLMWCSPVLSGLFFALLRIPRNRAGVPRWVRDTARGFRENALVAMCNLIFLLHQAMISADAIVRAMSRVFVTKKKMLEWETAAEAEAAARSKAAVDIYLECAGPIALGMALGVWFVRPGALVSAAPILALWAASRPFSRWLDRRARAGHAKLSADQLQLLRDSADRIWRFFHDWSSGATNWLIPDSVRDNGAVDLRLSPTNLGMLLNARIAALHLGVMPLTEFVYKTQQTLEQMQRLPKHRGHLLNWYDIESLQPVRPWFVSTVDSGNLAACLWTLKQAARAMASESPVRRGVTKELAGELMVIAERCHRIVAEMDFSFLCQPRKHTLSVGYDVGSGRLEAASYNLLASEARMAYFVAIAKGDVPQESWFHLDRTHTVCHGERVLLSWSGTMFEYLMPALWMRHYPDTIVDRAMKAAVRSQREYGISRSVPWGISESAFLSGSKYGYRAFGVPHIAMDTGATPALVISPYSTFLAAAVDPAAAAENLDFMRKLGWLGRYGFYEAVDYTRSGGEAVRMWMAHHQGMSLLSIVNLLYDNPLRRYFHSEPQVRATELLLQERPAVVETEAPLPSLPEVQPAAA